MLLLRLLVDDNRATALDAADMSAAAAHRCFCFPGTDTAAVVVVFVVDSPSK